MCFLALTAIPLMPIIAAIHYDGIASVWDWPQLFDWFAICAAAFFAVGLYLLFFAPRIGAYIRFREDGLQVEVRMYLRKVETHDLTWSEIDKVEVVLGGHNNDGVTIRPKDGPIASIPMRLVGVTAQETLKRLRISAEAANYRFERAGSTNVFIVSRETWRVVRNDAHR